MISREDIHACLWLWYWGILAETWGLVCLQALGDQIIFVTRPDKKKILFYNDKHCQFMVDEGERRLALSSVTWHLPSLLRSLSQTQIQTPAPIPRMDKNVMISWSEFCPAKKKKNIWFAEFQKLWRSIPVDSMDEEKIEEYLKKQGISSMQETGPKKVVSVTCLIFIPAPQIKNRRTYPWCISPENKAF